MIPRRIKTIAVEYDVPLVENKIVARTLFALCRVGRQFLMSCFK